MGKDAALAVLAGGLDAIVDGNVDIGGATNNGLQMLVSDAIGISAGGNLTLALGTHLGAAGAGDALRLAVGGKFENQAGADALLVEPSNNGRWLVYLASPNDGHTFGDLDSGNTAVWNTNSFAPVSAAGNRYVFAHRPTLTFSSRNATKTYGETGTPFDFAVSGLMGGVAGAYLGDTLQSAYTGAPQLSSLGDTAGADVNTYAIGIARNTLASTAGYDFAFAGDGLLTVNRRALTVTAASQDKIYDATRMAAVTFGDNRLAGDDLTITGTALFGDKNAGSGKAVTVSGITLSGTDAGNYSVNTSATTFAAITPAALTVTVSDADKIYDGLAWGGGNGVSYSGFVNGEDAAVLGGTLGWGGTAQGAKDAGGYTLVASGLTSANYDINYAAGQLTVTPRSITVSALGGTSIYGDGGIDPGLSATNLANGEGVSVLSGLANSFGIVPENAAGSYTLSVAGVLTNGNYTVSNTTTGTWKVTPRAITVTADDLSRLLGQTDPALTWTVSSGSLASFDTVDRVFRGTLSRATGETIGDYAIGQDSLLANTNYAMAFVPGTFTIQPVQYTESQVLERPGGDDTLLLLPNAGNGDAAGTCTDGVLGPDCAAYVNAGNRDLGPHIGMTE